ncbi:sphingolipid hydroxylase [Eremomyces bilateralis CBS 781.70]|uniref:Sphingolipid hydroxylase n=1 Tax=Eremomyces bilateralis CBS 781.70 TaxID=1392243 RepID=A0A6G1G026_9PEZI|nr:sphingolipid hydroxylase [Eremomyces bilateralis CBS 781.70]KAF1811467.1 sphingolipid hydroxylase [Eremomyces bilateralis CBS 781.70]
MATANISSNPLASELPPLPSYTINPLPPLIPGVPDAYIALALPVIGYWVVSGIFHFIDIYDLFPQYRLHTPAEITSRNKVGRWEVFRAVIIQQVIQTVVGLMFSWTDPPAMYGKEDYDVAVWAQRIRLAQRAVPAVLGIVGLNANGLASKYLKTQPMLSGVLAGGKYPWVTQLIESDGISQIVPAFTGWEMGLAKAIYWAIIPSIQFVAALLIMDAWEYFWHRAMHLNKWLYATFHSHHHRLYVPYAYGALYNHWFEGFLLDTCGAGVGYLLTGMTTRQTFWFFTFSTIKTVDDHCGYALPWDPLQHITSNNAAYHDIHHQSWGIKTNFSQPFFIFWDRWMGTRWNGDVKLRYERDRAVAEKKIAEWKRKAESGESSDSSIPIVLVEQDSDFNASEEVTDDSRALSEGKENQPVGRRSPRKRQTADAGLKGLRERVGGGIHGRGSGLLDMEGSR